MGIPISGYGSFVASVFNKYPTNPDGSLPVDASRQESDLMGNTSWDVTYSNDMFVKADANHDGKVTPEELQAFVSRFDTNHNGQLDNRGWFAKFLGNFGLTKPSEYEKFTAQYHEVTVPGSENSY